MGGRKLRKTGKSVQVGQGVSTATGEIVSDGRKEKKMLKTIDKWLETRQKTGEYKRDEE